MKYLLMAILLSLPTISLATVHGSLEVGALNSRVVNSDIEKHDQMYSKIYLEYPLWRITPFASTEVWAHPGKKATSFSPYRSNYAIGLALQVAKNLKLIARHECIHPIIIDTQRISENVWMSEFTMVSFKLTW